MWHEDFGAIVIENGSGQCKAGISGEEFPRFVFPAIVGSPKKQVQFVGSGTGERESFVGDEAQTNRGLLSIRHPIEHGIITNWDDMEKIWHHALHKLGEFPVTRTTLLTEATLNPKANREKMTQVMFEKFNTLALHISAQAPLALYTTGHTSAIVCESGDGVTQIAAIYEGSLISEATQRMDVAGRDLTHHMCRLLRKRGFSFTTADELEIVRDIKEQCGSVALDFEKAIPTPRSLHASYELPDGTDLTVGDEKFLCPEAMFQPKLLGLETPGLPQYVHDCLMQCDVDMKKELYSKVYVTGGNVLFEGFAERLRKEIQTLSATNIDKSKIRIMPLGGQEQKYAVFLGASILAECAGFEDLCVTRQEYDEHGPCIIHKKCYL